MNITYIYIYLDASKKMMQLYALFLTLLNPPQISLHSHMYQIDIYNKLN